MTDNPNWDLGRCDECETPWWVTRLGDERFCETCLREAADRDGMPILSNLPPHPHPEERARAERRRSEFEAKQQDNKK